MIYVLTVIGSALAGIIQTVTGFGAGIFLMLIMPYFFDLVQSPALVGSITVILGISLSIRYRAKIKKEIVVRPIVLYMIGSLIALKLISLANLEALSLAFGIFLIGLSLFLQFSKNVKLSGNRILSTVMCIAGGFFSGLFSTGGPLVALFFLEASQDNEEYIANGQCLFMVTGLLTFFLRIYNGFYTLDLIPYTLIGIIGIVIGTLLGSKIAKRIDGTGLRRIIYVCVGLCGIVTLFR